MRDLTAWLPSSDVCHLCAVTSVEACNVVDVSLLQTGSHDSAAVAPVGCQRSAVSSPPW